MKSYTTITICIALLVLSCNSKPKQTTEEEIAETSIPEKIAAAHGFEHWDSVKSITFTFNVDRDTTHFERTWIWKPKTNDVTAISASDTLTYNRKAMDSTAFKINGGFINDRYWVLAPFNLIWDSQSYDFEHAVDQTAPISGKNMQKLTIVYANEGGYTPGDAYDFYFGDDFIIREWVFRKSNQKEASMTTTWENYVEIDGLKLPQDHRKANENFSLNFTNLAVEKE